MGSLREVKNRIGTVKNTRKITSAMRMVASAKLTKVEQVITNMLPYQKKLEEIVGKVLSRTTSFESPFTEERKHINKTALVVMSSNSSLCGGFNSSIIRVATEFLEKKGPDVNEKVFVYPIGRKVEESLRKKGYNIQGSYQELADKPSYRTARPLAKELMDKFIDKEIDQVIFIYYNFKSIGAQEMLTEQYLPLDLDKYRKVDAESAVIMNYDYIIEPSESELIADLIPQVLTQKLYTSIVDSKASGEAARSMAMQLATDNADDLIQDLTQQYNKSRQQAITNELLDIVGGSMR